MLYGCSPATFKGRREWMRFQSAQSDLGFRAHSRREVSGNFTAIGGFTLLLTAYAVLVWERSCEEFEHAIRIKRQEQIQMISTAIGMPTHTAAPSAIMISLSRL
jgi:hypothetical protein